MLLPALALVRRWRVPRSRADEVSAVGKRLGVAARAGASGEERELAKLLRSLKPQVLAAFAEVEACTGCARGRPEPHGHWNGGFCCGGETARVFDDDEVAALALGGTRARHLRTPDGDHAGCAFRGETGCTLDAEDRPSICVRFVCRELEAELREGDRWLAVRAQTKRLEQAFARFSDARDRRLAEEESP